MLGVLTALVLIGFEALSTGFPEDPAGVEIIDRAFCRKTGAAGEAVMYFRMYNSGSQGIIEVFRYGTDVRDESWDLVYSWKPQYDQSEMLVFQPVAVITLQENGDILLISWTSRVFLEYTEGIGALYLEYDFNSGEVADPFFSD